MKRNSMPYIVVDSLGEILGEYANMAEAIADAKTEAEDGHSRHYVYKVHVYKVVADILPVGKAEVITYE